MAPDLNEEVEVVVQDSDVITVPIDDTLSNSGEAADAKAVGDALALKADKSELQAAITVNGQAADAQGAILVNGTEIPMSGTDATTLKAAIEAVDGKTAADIKMSSASGAKTIAQEIADNEDKTAEDILMAPGSAVTVAGKVGAVEIAGTANSEAIALLQAKTGADIAVSAEDSTKIADALAARIRTVNGDGPDDNGNVQVQHALTADNLTSSASQNTTGEFVRRTSGGSASISTGDAWMSFIRGNRTHVGFVPEQLNMTVNAAPREQGETPITATIDRDTFVAYVSVSGTTSLTYTTSWSADPTLYGVTVTGTPVSGDQVVIIYVKEDRGTIIQSDPQTFVSTGWNLYDNEVGYAIGLKYADTAQFRIGGTYTAVKFSSTIDGTKSTITPSDGLFNISANGYIWVEGGNATDTYVFMTWSDWVLPDDIPEFEAYSESVIDLSVLMAAHFEYGLLRVADVRDEINFNTGIATSKVERISYSAENLAAAEASGLEYEYDTNYIYLERATPIDYDLDDYDLDGMYSVNDHGLEYFTGSDIAVYAVQIYGNNLKNKLERDVLTKSQDLVNNLTTNDATKALSAAQGYALNSKISNHTVENSGTTWYAKSIDGQNIYQLQTKPDEIAALQYANSSWSRFWTLFPTEMGNTVSSDLNTVANGRLQIYRYDSNTLHSPYKEHSDWGAEGLVLSYLSNANFGVQLGLISAGSNLTIRTRNNGTWSAWKIINSAVPT